MPFEVDLTALETWDSTRHAPAVGPLADQLRDVNWKTPLTVAFEDAIPLSSRFAIMKVELDGPPGPDWDLANSVRWLIAMNLLLAKLDATNFTLSSVVVVPKHRNEPNMTRDSKVIELRSIRPPRAAPSQLPGVLQPGGIQPVCFSVAPLVPLEYRVVDFGQVEGRHFDFTVGCGSAQVVGYAIDQLKKHAAHVKHNETAADGWTRSYLVPPAVVEERNAEWVRVAACAGCGRKETEGERFKKCSACFSPVYCGRECQVKHWKNGHKQECKKPPAASASPAEGNGASGTTSGGDDGPTVLISMVPPVHMQGMMNTLINVQGRGTHRMPKAKNHAPKDIHGGKRFVVKVQLPLMQLGAGALIYDEHRSFQQQAMSVPDSLVAVVRSQHQWRGMKAYIMARREGENLRLYLDQVQERATW